MRRPSLLATEQWLFQDIKTHAPIMHMILQPADIEEILNRGVYRMKLKADDAQHAQAARNPTKAAVPPEKTASAVNVVSPGRGLHQPVTASERCRMPPLSTFKSKRGLKKERTP